MPTPGMLWRHVICHTRNTWLHGDERGFRDRKHRLHSSGDYNAPPAKEEHEGLRRWARQRAGEPVLLPPTLRPAVVDAIVARMKLERCQALIVSCSQTHIHGLIQSPPELTTVKAIVGRCKRNACRAVSSILTGSVWAAGGSFKPIADREHHESTFHYIATQQEPGTFVWTFRGERYWMM